MLSRRVFLAETLRIAILASETLMWSAVWRPVLLSELVSTLLKSRFS